MNYVYLIRSVWKDGEANIVHIASTQDKALAYKIVNTKKLAYLNHDWSHFDIEKHPIDESYTVET